MLMTFITQPPLTCIIRFDSNQAPGDEVKCVIHEEVCYIHKVLVNFIIHSSRSLGDTCGNRCLRVLCNGKKNIKLDEPEFIPMDPLSRDSHYIFSYYNLIIKLTD